MSFEKLNLIEPIKRSLAEEGYVMPTPIQEQAIPYILKGRDILGCSQTGTGKTAAFAVPILQNLYLEKLSADEREHPRALILSPTRELTIQINESFSIYGKYTGLKNAAYYGGVKMLAQLQSSGYGVDIVVATPGRLTDMMNQGKISLDKIQVLVLDEADKMFDLGFAEDLNKVLQAVPKEIQTLFFSASMPPDMAQFASNILTLPVRIEVAAGTFNAPKIKQAIYFVSQNDKTKLLFHLIEEEEMKSVLIFVNDKKVADKIVEQMNQRGIPSRALHGKKSQNNREQSLAKMKEGHLKVLVATDVLSRGIDIEFLSHVINYDMPREPESYIHRIGRTGRAGAAGFALSFCNKNEMRMMERIEQLNGFKIPIIVNHPFHTNEHYSNEIRTPKPTVRREKAKIIEPEAEALPTMNSTEYVEPVEDEIKKQRRRIVKKDQTLISESGKKTAGKPVKAKK